jgi:hypothetical protein
VVVAAVAIAVFMALAWVALFSGGVARRRIHALAGGQGPKRSRLQRHKSDLGGRVSVA